MLEDFTMTEKAQMECESAGKRFQLGEGPSRGLLPDYEPSDGPPFQALPTTHRSTGRHQHKSLD